jgi:hypothetical protein
LPLAGQRNTFRDLAASLGRRRQDEIGGGDRRYFDIQVDAVDQRAGNTPLIIGRAARIGGAAAGITGIVGVTAAAGIHCRHQHEARRVGDAMIGAGDRDLDRQVVVAAFLRQICRREVDGDAAGRQSEPGGNHGRAHSFTGLGNCLVRQAHDGECRHARRDLHLDVDRPDLDAFECDRGDALDHVRPRPGPHPSGTWTKNV